MRDITEIKFRQITIDGGFHYWGYVDKRYKETFTTPISGESEQYTGLTDRNNKEWCEGDKSEIEDGCYGVVVFKEGSFCFSWYEMTERNGAEYIETTRMTDYHVDGMTIDGNIHGIKDSFKQGEDYEINQRNNKIT